MNTAHLKNHKKIILTAGFIAVSSVFLSIKSGVLAQDFMDSMEKAEPTLYDETNPTRTIAQDQIALTAIPPRLGDDGSITAAPGEKLQVQVRVRNISEQPVSVVTSAQDFILDVDGETPVSIDDKASNRWSLASWLTITPTEHNIDPKSTVGINVLIQVPEDALPGGHYAMILHEPGLESTLNDFSLTQDSGSGAAINQRVGTLLYVVVDGPINEEAYVRDFSFPNFTDYGPVPFSLTVENNSDVHITPQMDIEIYNVFNQKVETIAIESKNIFPLSNRKFAGSWNRVWGFGYYKAKLTMSYGSSGSVVMANTSFWLIPLKLVLAGIALLMIIFFIAYSIKRHLNHRKAMDEKKIQELESQIESMQSKGDQENTL